ncbi:hypothetical protein LK09_00920 [Microbacterium mangrovi]|uniref:Uncharacterized protein n=1 Tax=Microbacterium mangrovi TaxID=1348253 RepID=A0A0B2A9T0_9MICO|nr:hypothetical protein [Microbacterium mangrovi]KHK99924.1 hypothetical protein LK09_00920 [Microbacterium mangrovi]
MKLPVYLTLLLEAERTLARSFREVARGHGDEPDIHFLCLSLADQCDDHVERLRPALDRYGTAPADDEPEQLHHGGLDAARTGPLGLLRDLQDLFLLATMVDTTWTIITQVAQALPDRELLDAAQTCQKQTTVQLQWIRTRTKQAAPQALVAAP